MEPPVKRRTAIRSFRLDEAALAVLEEEARQRNISVNTLVNQLLLTYTNFERHFAQYPMVRLSSTFLGWLLEGVTDAYAKDLGQRVGENLAQAGILSRHGSLSLESVLANLRMMGEYSGAFTFKEVHRPGRTTVTLFHKWGRKGSIYWGHYLLACFELVHLHPKLTTTEHSVTVAF